jgi:hypothetical protein
MSQNQSPTEANGPYTADSGTGNYDPDAFSQPEINRGQRRINYELVEVTKKLADALEKLIEKLSPGQSNKFKEVSDLITEARKIANAVAGIRPPGCDPPTTP